MAKEFPALLQKRYRFKRILGSGGSGIVALAFDEQLQRQVAIKRLHPNASQRLKARIKREAHIMAGLKHPNVLQIFDVFEEDNVLHLVTEYANHGSLNDLLKRRKYAQGLPVQDVINIALALVKSLKTAHQLNIVHRDIKPANILLNGATAGYIIKLADFGVAHLPDTHTVLTQSGEIVGTPPYLAPEQVEGAKITPATDVYALGILLYRLLTNRHYLSFNHDEQEMYRRILNEAPLPFRASDNIPTELSSLIMRMLRKHPAQRPSMNAISKKLHALATHASPKNKVLIQNIPDFKPLKGRIPTMRNLIKFTALIVIAFLVFRYTSGDELSIPELPDTLPNSSQIVQRVIDSVNIFTPLAVDSSAVVENADLYNGLKLRSNPNRDATILRSLQDGTHLQILKYDRSKDWAFVETENGTQGWVFATGYLHIAEIYQLATY